MNAYYDAHKEQCPLTDHAACSLTLKSAIEKFEAGVSKLRSLTQGTPWQVIAAVEHDADESYPNGSMVERHEMDNEKELCNE